MYYLLILYLLRSTAYRVEGYFDYFITGKQIIEFKCVNSLSDENKIQCWSYIAMYYINTGQSLPCKLFNTRCNELVTITIKDSNKFLDIPMILSSNWVIEDCLTTSI